MHLRICVSYVQVSLFYQENSHSPTRNNKHSPNLEVLLWEFLLQEWMLVFSPPDLVQNGSKEVTGLLALPQTGTGEKKPFPCLKILLLPGKYASLALPFYIWFWLNVLAKILYTPQYSKCSNRNINILFSLSSFTVFIFSRISIYLNLSSLHRKTEVYFLVYIHLDTYF